MAWKVSHHALADPRSCCAAKRTFCSSTTSTSRNFCSRMQSQCSASRGSLDGVKVGGCLEEVLVRGRSLRTMGTTPVLTVAPGASAGEARDSLCHNVHGTGCLSASSHQLSHHLCRSHRRRRWWRRERMRSQRWNLLTSPVRALNGSATVTLVKGPNMARGGVNSLFKNLQIN